MAAPPQSAHGDERATPRRRVAITTFARSGPRSRIVDLVDLSRTGFLMRAGAEFGPGERITLVLDPATASEHAAAIVWSSGSFFGCRFEERLDPESYAAALLAAPASEEDEADGAPRVPGALGRRLRELRERSPYTMEELAERAGLSKPTLWKWETGRSEPRDRSLARLAEALGVSLRALRIEGPGAPATTPGQDTSMEEVVAQARADVARAAGVEISRVRISIVWD